MVAASVMANRMRPLAIRAERPTSPASPNLVATLAAMVLPARLEDAQVDVEGGGEDEGHGDGLAEGAAEAEDHRPDHAAAARREAPTCGSSPTGWRPSASAASRRSRGTCRNTSRDTAATMGRTIRASTTEAAKTDLP